MSEKLEKLEKSDESEKSDDDGPPDLEPLYDYTTKTKGNNLIIVQTHISTKKELTLELKIGDCIRFIRRPNGNPETVSAKIIGFLQGRGGIITGIQYLTWKPEIKKYADHTFPPRKISLEYISDLGDYTTIEKVNCNEPQAPYSLVKGRISSIINKKGGKNTKKRKSGKRGTKKSKKRLSPSEARYRKVHKGTTFP
jgi:hypothetical protein